MYNKQYKTVHIFKTQIIKKWNDKSCCILVLGQQSVIKIKIIKHLQKKEKKK